MKARAIIEAVLYEGTGDLWLGNNRSAIYRLLFQAIKCGPFDGGCVTFAKALQLKYGGEIIVLIRKDGVAEHAALHVGGMFIDAEGPVASAEELISRFNQEEHASTVGWRTMKSGDLNDAPQDQIAKEIVKLLPSLGRS